MSSRKLFTAFCLWVLVGAAGSASAQYGGSTIPNLRELPITLTWDDSGIRIVAKTANPLAGNLLQLMPSRYLEQIGNDLIRVAPGNNQAPVIIDLSNYFAGSGGPTADASRMIDAGNGQIRVEMPKLTLANYNEPNSFIVEIRNFSRRGKDMSQTFLFRGMDIFYVNTSECVQRSSHQNRILLDVGACQEIKYLVLEGGRLNLSEVEDKIPALCNKYNDRYYSPGQHKAFLCVRDCLAEGEEAMEHLQHVRGLVTKYNITDYEDAPLAYIGDIILTKKGVGFNLKNQLDDKLFKKKTEFNAFEAYKFFPWYEFINLTFSKHQGERQIAIADPYNNHYLYDAKVYFTNVELIQFFSELKALISERVN